MVSPAYHRAIKEVDENHRRTISSNHAQRRGFLPPPGCYHGAVRKENTSPQQDAPLDGLLVVDLSRMLPGAVLARQLLDLGARLIKIEAPGSGDFLRDAPPLVDGIGAGFSVFLRGAESVCLDLRIPSDAERIVSLIRHADVLVESFRPGTMEGWRLGPDRLREVNPALVWCSLSGFGRTEHAADRVGHDLNFTARSGLLSLISDNGVPSVQLVDVTGGLLAASAILAGLLVRHRDGCGVFIDQPLAIAPLPFLTWAWGDHAAGGEGLLDTLLAGRCPCYRRYRCADGKEVAVAAIEGKFWQSMLQVLGLPQLADSWVDAGEAGHEAALELAAVFARHPRDHWLTLADEHGLPISPVHDLAEACSDSLFAQMGLLENTPMADGSQLSTPGPFLPSLGRTPSRCAPRLGEHTEAVFEEFGLQD